MTGQGRVTPRAWAQIQSGQSSLKGFLRNAIPNGGGAPNQGQVCPPCCSENLLWRTFQNHLRVVLSPPHHHLPLGACETCKREARAAVVLRARWPEVDSGGCHLRPWIQPNPSGMSAKSLLLCLSHRELEQPKLIATCSVCIPSQGASKWVFSQQKHLPCADSFSTSLHTQGSQS